MMCVPQYVDFLKNQAYRIGVPLKVVSETPPWSCAMASGASARSRAHRLLDLIPPRAKVLGLAAGTARG